MNPFKQNLFLGLIFLISAQLCYAGALSTIGSEASKNLVLVSKNLVAVSDNLKKGMEQVGVNACRNTWWDIKKTCEAVAASIGIAAKVTYTYGGAVIAAHPYVAGTVAVGGLCYGGYRFYESDVAKKAALALRQSKMALKERAQKLAEENAKVTHEIMMKEMHIKEENARVALEIMQHSAKVKNIVILTATATTAGIVLGCAGYRLYKSIQEGRRKGKLERDLLAAKQVLLDTIVINAQREIGLFGVPAGCQQAASTLLALPGGEQTLDKIVGTFSYAPPRCLA
jgi:hypothetical protein